MPLRPGIGFEMRPRAQEVEVWGFRVRLRVNDEYQLARAFLAVGGRAGHGGLELVAAAGNSGAR